MKVRELMAVLRDMVHLGQGESEVLVEDGMDRRPPWIRKEDPDYPKRPVVLL